MGIYDIPNYQPSNGAMNASQAYFQQQQNNPSSGGGLAADIAGIGAGIPGVGNFSAGNMGAATPFGFNLGTGQLLLGGLGAIANFWSAFEAQKLAKKQFEFQKDAANANLANQIQSYNTTLTDRINARSYVQGDGQDVTDAYLAANKLKETKLG